MFKRMLQPKKCTNADLLCNNCGETFNVNRGGFIVPYQRNAIILLCTACQYQLYLELGNIFEEPSHIGNMVWKNEHGFVTGNVSYWNSRLKTILESYKENLEDE